MPRSRALAVLAVALAVAGAVSGGLSATAGAAAASAAVASAPVASAPSAPSAPGPTPTGNPLDTISIDPAVVTDVAGGVVLSVTAVSVTELTSMTVQLLDATDGTDTLNPAMTQTGSTTVLLDGEFQSTWASATIGVGVPAAGGLPLGTYTYTVSAADAGGGSPAGTTTGPFAFQETPAIAPNPGSTVVSYGNQQPTVSGIVTTTGPGITTPVAYTGPLFLSDTELGNVPLTPNSSGGYSFTFTDPQPGEMFAIEVPPSTTVAAASTPESTLTVHVSPLAISAALSAKTITYGGKVTVSGTVRYEPGSTLVPLPGQAVAIYDRPGAPSPVMTVVTDHDGQFKATLPREASSVHWVLQASGPYLAKTSVTLPMKVNLPTVISGFQASLSQFWQLSFRGCLALPAGIPRDIGSLSGLAIQYASSPGGPWHTLGALPKQNSVVCGNGGRSFSGTLTAKLNYAYYRAWYAGSTDSTGTGFLAAASGRVLAWKYEDRITAFGVSSRSVPKGGKLTVKGQLQYFSGKWRDYAGQRVYVILRPQGSASWFFIVIATTNSAGRFSATFTDPVTAVWSAEFFGNSTHLATLAATVNVTVR